MVEYSLAKAEVEGSSPFFRLGFSFFSSVLQKSMKNLFFFCRIYFRYQKRVANKSRPLFLCAKRIEIICLFEMLNKKKICILLAFINFVGCAHIIRITNDGAE